MIARFAWLVFLGSLLVAAAVWVKGYAQVGDGFSAGIIAGLGALATSMAGQNAELGPRALMPIPGARFGHAGMVVGLGLVLLVVLGPTVFGEAPVTHFPRPGADVVGLGRLELHTAVLFDAGVGLLVYGAIVEAFEHVRLAVRGEDEGEDDGEEAGS